MRRAGGAATIPKRAFERAEQAGSARRDNRRPMMSSARSARAKPCGASCSLRSAPRPPMRRVLLAPLLSATIHAARPRSARGEAPPDMGVGWCSRLPRGFFDPSPPLKRPSEPPSPPLKSTSYPLPPLKSTSYPLPLPLPSPQKTPLQAPASPCKPFRLPYPPKKPPKAPKSPQKAPKAPPLSDMLHHPPPPRRRRGRGGWGGGVRGLPLHKRDTTARKTRQKRALVTFACPPPAWGEGGYRGRGAGTYLPPTYPPHPHHHTRAKMELPTATIPPPHPPPCPGKIEPTPHHHTTPTPTNQPPAPLFLGGGRGQKSPSVACCTTPPPYRAALATTEGAKEMV